MSLETSQPDSQNGRFFGGAVAPVPETMESRCAEEWANLGKPGTWWTAAERIAIARETRAARKCKLCAKRKASISPYGAGSHEGSGVLSAEIVDAVHRISSDPGRLSSRWHDELLAAGISDARLVELTGVIAVVYMVDTIARGTGARGTGKDEPALPEPQPGEPTRILPEGSTRETAWVPTVRPDKATGEIGEYYKALGGMSANIRQALTLVPSAAWSFYHLHEVTYVPGDARFMDMHYRTALSRPQMELIAATVSSANDCFY